MTKLWLVARHEFEACVQKRSYLLVLVGVPLAVAVLALVAVLLGRPGAASPAEVAVGYVDQADLLQNPAPTTGDEETSVLVRFTIFASPESARAALESGQIAAYFVLPADYLATRQAELVYVEAPRAEVTRQFQAWLQANLLADQPTEVVRRAVAGSKLTVRTLDGRSESTGTILGLLLPAIAGLIMVVLVFFSSGYLMEAVAGERANRTMEILATSASPNEFMAGKVLGIVGASLVQFGAWVVLALLFVLVGGQFPALSWLGDIRLDPAGVLLMAVVVVPSYVLVAAFLTAIGAMVRDARIGDQIAALVFFLYLAMLGFIAPIVQAPDGPVAVGLSLFPITAPVVLPLRAALGVVPFWQIAASVGLVVLCALGAIWLAGRALRLGMLRCGQGLSLRAVLGGRAPAALPRRGTHIVAADGGAVGDTAARQPARSKTGLVLRFELLSALIRPAMLLICLGLPLLIFVQLAVFNLAAPEPRGSSGAGSAAVESTAQPPLHAQGYVDLSGLVRVVPDNVPAGMLVAFPDEGSARQALAAGQIAGYYVVTADYVASGALVYVPAQYSPLASASAGRLMNWVLLVNLLGGDTARAGLVWQPLQVQETVLEAAPGQDGDMWTDLMPMLIMLVPYAVILLASGYLMRTVSEEKKNRTIEVLLLSLDPRQMLAGKTLAWGIVGLIQTVGLAVVGYLLFFATGFAGRIPAGLALSPTSLVWGVVLSVLGYALYASLMAGAGALMTDWAEARGPTFLITLPALLGFYVAMFATNDPQGVLVTAVSLFPLTAPFTMIYRLVLTAVPLWQLLLSCGLMVLTIYLLMRSVAALFRAQTLLSGQPFSIGRYVRALMGRE
jgi:ABC-2 type transport system permease protein